MVEGRRCAPDGSLTEQNRAFYILVKEKGHWKTACFSGVLTKAADVTPEEDAVYRSWILDPKDALRDDIDFFGKGEPRSKL